MSTSEHDEPQAEQPAAAEVPAADKAPSEVPGSWELLYGVLFQPTQTFEHLAAPGREAPLGLAAVVFTVVTLLGAWVSLSTALPFVGAEHVSALRAVPALVFIVSIALGVLSWFGWSAVLHLVAEFLGGVGSGTVLFALVGLSYLPRALAAPVAALTNVTGVELHSPFRVLLALWVLYLHFLAVRTTHQLNRTRALLAVILPGAAVLGLILIMVIMVIVAVLPFLGDMRELPL